MSPVTRSSNEVYSPHLLAQKLNNTASFLITTGDYDGGIAVLTKALRLAKQHLTVEETMAPCLCKCCSLESSLAMKGDAFQSLMDIEKEKYMRANVNVNANSDVARRCDQPSILFHNCSECEDDEEQDTTTTMEFDQDGLEREQHGQTHTTQHRSTPLQTTAHPASPAAATNDNENKRVGFVYDRPFLVNKRSIEEGHSMGIRLSPIILFNLALGHHLKAVSSIADVDTSNSKTPSISSLSSSNLHVLRQALQLYEIAYQLHIDYIQKQKPTGASSTASPQQGLDEASNERNIGHLRFTMIIANNLGEIHRLAGNSTKHKMCLEHLLTAIMYLVDCNLVAMDSVEMDGFYHNVTPVMLTDNCANAA